MHGLRSARPPLTLVTYAEEDYRSLGNTLGLELRARGYPVSVFKLWPASGPASYDSAIVAIARSPIALFATADRPLAGRGTIGLPQSMMASDGRDRSNRADDPGLVGQSLHHIGPA